MIAVCGQSNPLLLQTDTHLLRRASVPQAPHGIRAVSPFDAHQVSGRRDHQVRQVGTVQPGRRPGRGIARRRESGPEPTTPRTAWPPTSGLPATRRPDGQGRPARLELPRVPDLQGRQVVFDDAEVRAHQQPLLLHDQPVRLLVADQIRLGEVVDRDHVGQRPVDVEANQVKRPLPVRHDGIGGVIGQGHPRHVGTAQALRLAEPLDFSGGLTLIIEGHREDARFHRHEGQSPFCRHRHIHAARRGSSGPARFPWPPAPACPSSTAG